MSVALRPRNHESPRARRLAAEASETRATAEASGSRAASVAFAVAEVEVDLTAMGDDVIAYVAKAVVDALPADPVHLAVESSLIHHAGDLNLVGLRRRLSERGSGPVSDDATFTIVVSSLTSETVPPSLGQVGTLVIGSTVERAAVVRLSDGSSGIAVRSFARLTFTYDHRALGRDDAVRFLTAVKRHLETP